MGFKVHIHMLREYYHFDYTSINIQQIDYLSVRISVLTLLDIWPLVRITVMSS